MVDRQPLNPRFSVNLLYFPPRHPRRLSLFHIPFSNSLYSFSFFRVSDIILAIPLLFSFYVLPVIRSSLLFYFIAVCLLVFISFDF